MFGSSSWFVRLQQCTQTNLIHCDQLATNHATVVWCKHLYTLIHSARQSVHQDRMKSGGWFSLFMDSSLSSLHITDIDDKHKFTCHVHVMLMSAMHVIHRLPQQQFRCWCQLGHNCYQETWTHVNVVCDTTYSSTSAPPKMLTTAVDGNKLSTASEPDFWTVEKYNFYLYPTYIDVIPWEFLEIFRITKLQCLG